MLQTRRQTRTIQLGNKFIGGKSPVTVQSMTKTDTRDVLATVAQIKELEEGEWIPKSLFTNSPHRYYTPEQVRLICDFYDVVKVGDLEQMKVKSEIVFNQWLEGI